MTVINGCGGESGGEERLCGGGGDDDDSVGDGGGDVEGEGVEGGGEQMAGHVEHSLMQRGVRTSVWSDGDDATSMTMTIMMMIVTMSPIFYELKIVSSK